MNAMDNKGKTAVNTNVEEERKMMETWPTTKAPKVFTETPIPMQNTNPPIVVPVGKKQPPPPRNTVNPPADRDVTAEAGASDDMDFRPDLSEYQLIVVKDKDVPNNTGYNPRAKLKFFPKGHMPGTNETFYLVTHRFADRAGIMAAKRGQLTVKSDSRGFPQAPLRAEMGGAGGTGTFRTSKDKENADGTTDPADSQKTIVAGLVAAIAVLVLVVYIARKNRREGLPL